MVSAVRDVQRRQGSYPPNSDLLTYAGRAWVLLGAARFKDCCAKALRHMKPALWEAKCW